jgi:RNA polymerase sigma-70 factor (ECF subfamily)
LYDQLVQIDDSPVIALNRAVAIAEVHGLQAGVEAVEAVQNNRQLESTTCSPRSWLNSKAN